MNELSFHQQNFNWIRFCKNVVSRERERERQREKKDKLVSTLFIFRSHSIRRATFSNEVLSIPRRRTKEEKKRRKKRESSSRERAREPAKGEAKIPKRIIISGWRSADFPSSLRDKWKFPRRASTFSRDGGGERATSVKVAVSITKAKARWTRADETRHRVNPNYWLTR